VLDDPRISRRPIPQGWVAFSSIAYLPLTSTDTLRLRNNIPNLFGMLSFKRLPTASTNTNNPGGLRIQRHRAQQFACEFIRHSRNSGLLTLFLIYSVQPPTTSLPYALTIHRDEWHPHYSLPMRLNEVPLKRRVMYGSTPMDAIM